MKVIAELSVIPIGVGVSLSKYIAECERILKSKNLKIQLHSEGTNFEGELEDVLNAVKNCIDAVHRLGAPRVATSLKISSRIDKIESMQEKINSVDQLI